MRLGICLNKLERAYKIIGNTELKDSHIIITSSKERALRYYDIMKETHSECVIQIGAKEYRENFENMP